MFLVFEYHVFRSSQEPLADSDMCTKYRLFWFCVFKPTERVLTRRLIIVLVY